MPGMSLKRMSVADLEREAIDRARVTPSADKLLEGLQLFDRACLIMSAGIRHACPDAGPDEVLRILRDRLRLARDLETR